MKITDTTFHRIFSKSMYKNLHLPIWEMTFSKDFVNTSRGDLYPIISKSDDCDEAVCHNEYILKSGKIERLAGAFFPFATYEISFSAKDGACGFSFRLPEAGAEILFESGLITFCAGDESDSAVYVSEGGETTAIISCRPGAFDVYILKNEKPEYITTFRSKLFEKSNRQDVFQKSFVCMTAQGDAVIYSVRSYIDCGISQADVRPIKYENGDVIYENGKVFILTSIRMQEGAFQGVLSWVPATSDFELVGAIFFDSGDGVWRNYLASSIIFNREKSEWYLWTSSFENGHILCHARFTGDPRFGVNIIDTQLMKTAEDPKFTDFLGIKGDEDPDLYYDAEAKKWYMAICRVESESKNYRYVFFESDEPFDNYKCIGFAKDGEETGGSFVKIGDERVFVCGNSFSKRSDYRIYTKDALHSASFDFDDGGFRGWGTVIPISMGSRKRYFWLTFDRHNGSSYNWSYGNIYCFEAIHK